MDDIGGVARREIGLRGVRRAGGQLRQLIRIIHGDAGDRIGFGAQLGHAAGEVGRVTDDEPYRGGDEDVPDEFCGLVGVDGYVQQPGRQNGRLGHDRVRAVWQAHRHGVTGCGAEPQQQVREAVCGVPQFRVAQALAGVDDREGIGVPLCRSTQPGRQWDEVRSRHGDRSLLCHREPSRTWG
ncbi:hypothetical protein SAMN05661093_06445 [Kibdelosporangium aridum]|uniref:Uncharacterized protein n=1 Tax=Kibdelosporangium aridum TaxID=2030 RepID=A0A1Y5XWL6_KIBAR|nr:hypothetical protein SAMN05661093_06445 [Kibdelosporangium aridum]